MTNNSRYSCLSRARLFAGVALFALLVVCTACVNRSRIEIDPHQPIHSAQRQLQGRLAAEPRTGCLLAMGQLPPLPKARPVRLVAGSATLDVVAVCDLESQRALLHDPRIKSAVLLMFRDRRFLLSHPADTTIKAELPAPTEGRSAQQGLFADPHPEGSAEDVIAALGELTQRFLIVVWDLAA